MNPERIIDGSKVEKVAIKNATCWEFAITEMNIPKAVEAII